MRWLTACLIFLLMLTTTTITVYAEDDESLSSFFKKTVVDKLNEKSYEIFLDQLDEYMKESYGREIGGNADVFKKIVDIGKINTALEVGENIYAGDYKAAAGVTEMALIEAYVPYATPVLLTGKALDIYIKQLNEDIFNANIKKIYNDIYKAHPEYFSSDGVEDFYLYLYTPAAGKLKVRAFFYEYAQKVGNQLPDNWATEQNRDANKTQVRVVINTLRRDMLKLQKAEEDRKKLEEQRRALRAGLDGLKTYLKQLASQKTKDWMISKVAQLLQTQRYLTEAPAMMANIQETFNKFMEYYNYFMKLVNSGKAVEVSRRGGEYDGGPGCTCPPPGERRALSAAASYSLVQAAQFNDRFKGLADDFRVLFNGLEKAAEGTNNTDLLKVLDAAKEMNQNFMQPENKVAAMYAEMQDKVKELDLGEKDADIQAGTKPDGLDPQFAPNVLNLDNPAATTPK
ncbi:MAG: hypothetical protein PHV60_05890 [bacterium]|nr:hypothetical protein [bacterium]